jgi:hypothetical protein
MHTSSVRNLIEEQTRAFLARGGEIVRYASPEQPSRIRLGSHRKIRNLKEEAWQRELAELRRTHESRG